MEMLGYDADDYHQPGGLLGTQDISQDEVVLELLGTMISDSIANKDIVEVLSQSVHNRVFVPSINNCN